MLAAFQCLQAAIPLGEIQTFDSPPTVTEWSTASITGTGGSITTRTQLDAAVQSVTVASGLTITNRISKRVGNRMAQWRRAPNCLITQPTDNACTLIIAAIQNSTEADVPNPAVSFDMTAPASEVGEDPELTGYRVYLSPYGSPDSWLLIP